MNRRLEGFERFDERHLGPRPDAAAEMLKAIGSESIDALVHEAVPDAIRMERALDLPPALTETRALSEIRRIADRNIIMRSMIGMGYYGTVTPPVILRNILENPGWYTQYTPYQAEIAQGRLEALVNFQTMVSDLVGLPLANASLLDEGTAVAEAMSMSIAITRHKRNTIVVSPDCHPQTIAVLQTRAEPLDIRVKVADPADADLSDAFAVVVQYPATDGRIRSPQAVFARAHEAGALAIAATDLLALTLLEPPGALGADIVVGAAQRFGVPMGAGGPHAAFLATKEEHKRHIPGRIIGVSRDARGQPAYRLALQTREQHIRRDKATSNICTAQVLLAIISGAYAVYHGPEGLLRIARRVRSLTRVLATGLRALGESVVQGPVFDTLRVECDAERTAAVLERARSLGLNFRAFDGGGIGLSLDETTTPEDVVDAWTAFSTDGSELEFDAMLDGHDADYGDGLRRTSAFLEHEVFNTYHSEHELLRYLFTLQGRDLSLTSSMIPLGSCTMKLNSTAEMIPVTWPEFADIHPFAPPNQQDGYRQIYADLEAWLSEITGFSAVSLQPNAGSQGEYTGLLTIRAYQRDRGETHRRVCLIPTSAHGTNPASAVMAGMKVVPVACDEAGDIDIADLEEKARRHADELSALMVTYPSTHGVFEAGIRRVCEIVHECGGQVYLDGANMNAQVGLCRPGDYGADVCHLNLHKTFCIPHGGGGPGMGPIGVAAHLAPFLPGHPFVDREAEKAIGPVASAPFGSPSILPISWMYIRMMGPDGLRRASELSILNANYMANQLKGHYDILYRGAGGRVAHEFIIDMRPFKKTAGVEVDDIAKRLMDFGFHAPTMSWPVAGTMMVEPTESESKAEIDRYCEALVAIREEIASIESGDMDRSNNPLKSAPHTAAMAAATEWNHPYPREQAVFPRPWIRTRKFWPPVARVDNAYGDRHLVCTCPSVESFSED